MPLATEIRSGGAPPSRTEHPSVPCVDGPSDARGKMRILTGRSIAIMCPALSTLQHVRWPRWVPQSSPKQQRGKAFAWNSIHIEFAAKDQPLTEEQMFWGADLLAWISREHP